MVHTNRYKMIDIVIPYTEGATKGIELKLCIQGIKRFMLNHYNVYIIGDKPSFDGDYIHIPDSDRGRGKQDNIRLKILTAFAHPEITDPFLFMNDDYFLLKEMDAQKVPYLYNKTMIQAFHDKRKIGSYKTALQNTVELIGADAMHYDIHFPIIYWKDKFKKYVNSLPWNDWRYKEGFVIKSVYSNKIPSNHAHQQMEDPKLKDHLLSPEEIHEVVKDWPMFSTDENSFNSSVIDYLTSINICV